MCGLLRGGSYTYNKKEETMKNLELILWGLMVIIVMSGLMAIYDVVNKKATPLQPIIMIITVAYVAIHILNNWK